MEVEVLRNDPRHRGNAFCFFPEITRCSVVANLGGTSGKKISLLVPKEVPIHNYVSGPQKHNPVILFNA